MPKVTLKKVRIVKKSDGDDYEVINEDTQGDIYPNLGKEELEERETDKTPKIETEEDSKQTQKETENKDESKPNLGETYDKSQEKKRSSIDSFFDRFKTKKPVKDIHNQESSRQSNQTQPEVIINNPKEKYNSESKLSDTIDNNKTKTQKDSSVKETEILNKMIVSKTEVNPDKKSVNEEVEHALGVTSQNSNKSISNIIKDEFDKKSHPKNPLVALFRLLTSTWFINTVAISLILGFLLFYFDGLQPRALQEYIDNAQSQTNQLQNDFGERSAGILPITEFIAQVEGNYSIVNLCNTEAKVDLEQAPEIDSLLRQILPNVSLDTLDKVQVYYEQEVLDQYTSTYELYVDSLNKFGDVIEQAKDYFIFLSFRNLWITACEVFYDQASVNSDYRKACQDLLDFEEPNLEFVPSQEEKTLVTESLEKCQTLIQALELQSQDTKFSTLSSWQSQWYDGYESIMNATFDIESASAPALASVKSLNNKFQESMNEYQRIEDEKTSFTGIWYILDFEL